MDATTGATLFALGYAIGFAFAMILSPSEQEIYDKLANGDFKKEIKRIEYNNGVPDTVYTLIEK